MSKDIDFKGNPAILNDYLLYLRNTKNFSLGTIKGYESDLKMFFNFILNYKQIYTEINKITIFTIMQIKSNDVFAFLTYLNFNNNNCATTRQRKLAAIKSFYKWLYTKNPGIKKDNPIENIPNITKQFTLPKYLTLNQARKIQTIFTSSNSQNPIRDNAIITLFLSTGIRISELLGINMEDIDFTSKSILIKGKGNKERVVYISDRCKNLLEKYIESRKSSREDALFISSLNVRISKSSIESICHKAYKLMNLDNQKYTVHTLRHTFATIMYDSSKDILLIKELLGHSTITSTEIYTHINNTKVKEAVNKNPLSNYKIAT